MRAIVSMMVAVGILAAGATVAAAMPADGAAITGLEQQVDHVVMVKKGKKSKTSTPGTPTSRPPKSNESY